MTIYADGIIYDRLKNDAAFNAAVSGRFWLGLIPNDPKYPCAGLVFEKIEPAHDFSSSGAGDLNEGLYTVTVCNQTYQGAKAIADLVHGLLNRWRNQASSPAVSDSFFHAHEYDYTPDGKAHLIECRYRLIHG